MSALKQYWSQREPYEQVIMAGLLTLSLFIILVFYIISPVFKAHNQAETALRNAERDYITVARTLPSLLSSTTSSPSNFNQGVFIAAAQRRGINPSRVQPDGNRSLTVWIETQDTQALYGLLNDVITRHGARLSRASIATNANQTLSAQFTFALTP